MMKQTLYLSWQDPLHRRWFPIGRLLKDNGTYLFTYTKGVHEAQQHSNFEPLPSFPDLTVSYASRDIFPLFANRMLPRSRPEYSRFVEWMSVSDSDADPLALLARSGGERVTDTFEVFPLPEKGEDGLYHFHFFVHGLRHQSPDAIKRAEQLMPGEKLLLMADFQNEHDPGAFVLRTAETKKQDMYMVGYLPCYLVADVGQLLQEDATKAGVEVVRVNPSPAPIHFRILCHLSMHLSEGSKPFNSEAFQPLIPLE